MKAGARPPWRLGPALAAALVLLAAVRAGAVEFARIDNVEPDVLRSVPFRVRQPLTVHVECEGTGDPDGGDLDAYGWILNLRSREVVWGAQDEEARRGPGANLTWRGDVDLPAGDYVAYYSPFLQEYKSFHFRGKEWARIRIKRDGKKPRGMQRWGLRLSVPETEGGKVEVLERVPHGDDSSRFVDLTPMGDSAFRAQGFRLPERMQITVYCQGEYTDDERGAADSGWITNAETRALVWEFGPDNFEDGGGDSKNKRSRETIVLPAGKYVASYSTDDSHSYEGWNAPPPYDPDGWGLMLSAASPAQAQRIGAFDESEAGERTLISMVKLGDNVEERQGFTLRRETKIRVYCLGEYSEDNGLFVDQGRIEKFGSDEILWEMTPQNTHHAGGARKNRYADEWVRLPAGDYVVYYYTDDSHSYPDFNQPGPRDKRHWGITLYGAGGQDASSLQLFDPDTRAENSKDYLVRLVRVRSNEHVHQRFKLDKTTRVHILGVGEGTYNTMYDYGWIETVPGGDWVWEMTMRNTRHAGGDESNRRFDGTLELKAGEYEAHFVTDEAHAWNDWRRPAPPKPDQWGLTIVTAPR